MKLKVRVGVDKWYQENQAKRLALDSEDVGVHLFSVFGLGLGMEKVVVG